MAEDFLSQEEVDALLKGATGDSDEIQDEEDKAHSSYNIGTQERIVRGRMPTYEISMSALHDYYASVYLISCGVQWISPLVPSK